MSTPGVTLNPYDEVPFPSQPLPQTRPEYLAAIARLFGMDPPPPRNCRVLELGCATGGNLLPMADRWPESHFVGIDYSGAQVAAAQRMALRMGLENVELRHADIAELGDELGDELGPFDYIICHGVFSWIPPALQDKVLDICRRTLSPQGVAYISYNVYPGWHVRGIIRELLCRHAHAGQQPAERVTQGRKLLDFFSRSLELTGTPACKQLKGEIDTVRSQPDSYIFHEYFEGDNRPEYFHEFVARLSPFGLQYLGEAAVATMFASNFGSKVERQLRGLAGDIVEGEQHLDVLRNRGFRQSLLCRDQHRLVRHLTPAQLERLHFQGQMQAQNPALDFQSAAMEKFTSPAGVALVTPSPMLKAALYQLKQQWPRVSSFEELFEAAARLRAAGGPQQPSTTQDRENLAQNLIQCLASGLVEITSEPDTFVTTISERPKASRCSRVEAQVGMKITNQRHLLIDVDAATRLVLSLLDGEHDHESMLRELMAAVGRGEISILVGAVPAAGGEAVAQAMREQLEHSLRTLAINAVLIG